MKKKIISRKRFIKVSMINRRILKDHGNKYQSQKITPKNINIEKAMRLNWVERRV